MQTPFPDFRPIPSTCHPAMRQLLAVKRWVTVWRWERENGADRAILANTRAMIRNGAQRWRELAKIDA